MICIARGTCDTCIENWKRKTEETAQKKEQELQVLHRENEEMKKKLGRSYTSPPNPGPPEGARVRLPPWETETDDKSCWSGPLRRPLRPTRPADILLPTLSLKSHYQTSGRVSSETDMTGLPTRTSILMH